MRLRLLSTLGLVLFVTFGLNAQTQDTLLPTIILPTIILPTIILPSVEVNTTWQRYSVGQRVVSVDSTSTIHFTQHTIADVLSRVCGVDTRNYGTSLSTVSMRGGGASHTALLWNGILLQNAMSGLIDFSTIPLGNQQFSYKLGGESALFGGGALGGILMLQQPVLRSEGLHISVRSTAGSFGDYRQQFSVAAKKGRLQWQALYNKRQSKNDFPYEHSYKIGRPILRQVNSAVKGQSIQNTLGYHFKDSKHSITWHTWWQNYDRQIAPTMTASDSKQIQQDNAARSLLLHQYIANNGARWINRWAATKDYLSYQSNVVPLSTNISRQHILESEYSAQWAPKWPYRVGLQYNKQSAASVNYDENKQRERASLFISQQFILREMKVNLNIRQERVDGKIIPTTASLGWEQNYKALKYRASLSRNYNLPGLNDLHWANLGNPLLKPELSHSAEVGADIEKIRGSNSFEAHATLYYMDIQQRIQWLPGSDGVWRPNNIANSLHRGLESNASWKRNMGNYSIESNVRYQYTSAINEEGYQLRYVPKHNAQADVAYIRNQLRLRFLQSYQSRRYSSSDDALWSKGFTLSTFEIGYSHQWKKWQYQFGCSIDNIFNIPYQVIKYYAMPGRSFQVHGSISL